ncbi:MAG: endoribonuclease MazF, partial [Dehalococcoidales bacterium]|nr:endoribonuclease MazF [Dehalococcoidales bacterium]
RNRNRAPGGQRNMVVSKTYIPRSGDVVWITLNPQAGHEQSGRRPVVVLSPESYNQKTGLAIFSPVTSQVKGYPFEVILPERLPVSGAVLSDQVKSLDWRIRQAALICALPAATLAEIMQKMGTLLGF